MNISKTAKRLTTALVVLAMTDGTLTACSSDENQPNGDGGSGGASTGGKATGGSAGKGTGGGATGGNGGKGSGGTGTGGKATGGAGGKSHEGGLDGDAGCVSPQALYYDKPGCNGTVAPVCAGPTFDACAINVCACDGETISGCGFYEKPYAHVGDCSDAGHNDAGKDGGDGG